MSYQIQKHKEKPKIQSVIRWIVASCDTALPQTVTPPTLSSRCLSITSPQTLFCLSPSVMGVVLTLKSLMHISAESTLVRAAGTKYQSLGHALLQAPGFMMLQLRGQQDFNLL